MTLQIEFVVPDRKSVEVESGELPVEVAGHGTEPAFGDSGHVRQPTTGLDHFLGRPPPAISPTETEDHLVQDILLSDQVPLLPAVFGDHETVVVERRNHGEDLGSIRTFTKKRLCKGTW